MIFDANVSEISNIMVKLDPIWNETSLLVI